MTSTQIHFHGNVGKGESKIILKSVRIVLKHIPELSSFGSINMPEKNVEIA